MSEMSDVAAERALLCGLVQNGREAYVDVQDVIGPHSFTKTENAVIYNCLCEMYESSFAYDLPSFLSAANSLGFTDMINTPQQLDYIKSLSQMKVELNNVRKHASKLSKLALIRQLQGAARETFKSLSKLNGTESIDCIMAVAEKEIFDTTMNLQSASDDGIESIGDGLLEYLDWLEVNKCDQIGISMPYNRWASVTGGGPRRGTTTLLGARPKTGKTTVAKDIALHVARRQIPVLVLDTEMNSKDQKNKILSSITKIKTEAIETGSFADSPLKKNQIINAAKEVSTLPYYYKSICGKGFDDVLSIIRRWIFQYVGFDDDGNTNDCLVIYDYFKLQESNKLKEVAEYQALGFQIADMTNFCIQYDIPTVAFVQLNREGIDKESTAAISQSDRLLWLCSSFTMIKRKTEEEIQEDGIEHGNMKFIPLEARFGPGLKDGDYISVWVDGATSSVEEKIFSSEIVKRKSSGNSDKISD